jgi:hypothetical protein
MEIEKEQVETLSPRSYSVSGTSRLIQEMESKESAWQEAYWQNVSPIRGEAAKLYQKVVGKLESRFPSISRACYVKDIEALAETSRKGDKYYPVVSAETIELFEHDRAKGDKSSVVALADLSEILFHEYGHIVYKERINEMIWDKWGPGFRIELDEAFAQWFGRHLGGSEYSTTANRFYFDINYPDQDPDTMHHAYEALMGRFGILPGEVKNPSLKEMITFLRDPKIKR